ncbi:MAG: protein kinase domain-containing protein [Planctomycetota bacterium]|jgi:hypothetical protein
MRQQLGNFRLLEQIEPGGYTTVYRAQEDLGLGFARPAAVKILHTVDMDDEAKAAVLRRETEVLVELCTCPNIVTVYGIGIDEEVGPWIAMELLGRSLKNFIADEPAEPDQVRVVLRDALRALSVVHGVEPPILHRDLKPNNILSTDYGNWVIADFGLARRWGADETLHLATVQYAAPELLDTTLGPESPRMDLYSLGMTAYEFALGRALYRKQFPSVYDPYAKSSEGDLRPKWMYWHTSMQMAVPPLVELIEDYPKDLSDLVAAMTAKPLDERPESASGALQRLGAVEGGITLVAREEEAGEEIVGERWRTPVLALVAVIVLVLSAVTFFWVRSSGAPSVQLAEVYTGTAPIRVNGIIEDFPKNGSATVTLPSGLSFPVFMVDDEGGFTCDVEVDELGETRGVLKVVDGVGQEVARKSVTLDRVPPEVVQLVLATRPMAPAANVVFTRHDKPDEPIRMRTGPDGIARLKMAYGAFDVEVTHPRFKPMFDAADTGIKPGERELIARLEAIPLHEIYKEMKDLIARIKGLASRKANCPPGPLSPKETERLDEHTARLAVLGEDDPDIEVFLDAVSRVEECNPASFAAVEEAAARAEAAVAEMEEALPPEERGPDADPGTARTAATAGGRRGAGAGGGPGRGGAGGSGQDPAATALSTLLGGGGGGLLGGGAGGGARGGGGGDGVQGGTRAMIDEILANAPPVDPAVVALLMSLPLDAFRDFILEHVPAGALNVEAVPELNMVRIKGPLFNDEELERLILRLVAAVGRLQLELRIDAWAVCRRLESRLYESGAEGIRVHAYMAEGDDTMFVQFTKDDAFDLDAVTAIAHEYVIDAHIARVQRLAG